MQGPGGIVTREHPAFITNSLPQRENQLSICAILCLVFKWAPAHDRKSWLKLNESWQSCKNCPNHAPQTHGKACLRLRLNLSLCSGETHSSLWIYTQPVPSRAQPLFGCNHIKLIFSHRCFALLNLFFFFFFATVGRNCATLELSVALQGTIHAIHTRGSTFSWMLVVLAWHESNINSWCMYVCMCVL